ncbi:MAG: hypothetical protein ACLUIO_18840 [Neglectibacter timonensis]
MGEIYFPSCNFTKASPEAAKRLRAYLKEKMPVAGCCRIDSTSYPAGNTALYFCQACRETLEAKPENQLILENLFVWLDRQEDYPWPDYKGLTVNIQDCWRDREHPEIFQGVRSVLQKLNVRAVELTENRERSFYCGNLHIQPEKPENIALLKRWPDTPLYRLPEDIQKQLMAEQVEKYTCPLTVAYCNRCTAGILLGGGRGVHLMELATGCFAG